MSPVGHCFASCRRLWCFFFFSFINKWSKFIYRVSRDVCVCPAFEWMFTLKVVSAAWREFENVVMQTADKMIPSSLL